MRRIIGIDEVGRGCIAGPVAACAFVFKSRAKAPEGLRDSKKLTALARERLFPVLCKSGAFGYGEASSAEIDELGIVAANHLAMQRALQALALPDISQFRLIVDGNQMPELGAITPGSVECIVKADDCVPAVSAASVIAKVRRDRIMTEMSTVYPGYGFERHSGYDTIFHRNALAKLGPSPLHRLSFAPIRLNLSAVG